MEVFEHLPLRVSQGVLETLRGSFRGRLFVTTPSYGIDEQIRATDYELRRQAVFWSAPVGVSGGKK